MSGAFSQASGTIMSTACGSERPPMWSSSSTSSKLALSDAPGVQTGNSVDRSSGSSCGPRSSASRRRIQLRLPRTVLISPLCAM
jgi:hypothetical protein